jgi:hypothetical protein
VAVALSTLPEIGVRAEPPNVLLLDADPFVSARAQVVGAFMAPDWTSAPESVPGNLRVTVETFVATDGGGLGTPGERDLGAVPPNTRFVLVNQVAPDIAYFNFTGAIPPPNPDVDGNGIADAWEIRHFGRTGIDPAGDPDGDGLTNLAESVANSDPHDPADPELPPELRVEIRFEAQAPGGAALLRFELPADAPEVVLEAIAALGQNWLPTPANVRVEGGRRVLEVPWSAAEPARFFRLLFPHPASPNRPRPRSRRSLRSVRLPNICPMIGP